MPEYGETIAIDFDGVLHQYRRGYVPGKPYDPPMEGAVAAMHKLATKGYHLVVLTARDEEDHGMIQDWLEDYQFPPMEVTNVKVPAFMYVDDHAVRFTTWRDVMNYIP